MQDLQVKCLKITDARVQTVSESRSPGSVFRYSAISLNAFESHEHHSHDQDVWMGEENERQNFSEARGRVVLHLEAPGS